MKKELIEKAATEELIHNYAVIHDGKFVYQTDAMLNMFLKGAEWMMQQFQWVSVEDKLPPCSDDYLFLLGIDSKGGKDIPDIGYMHDSADHVPRKDLFISTELIEVTHWMKVRNLTKNE